MAVQGNFGAKLKAAREARGISLRAVSTTTKISLVALEALEHDDPSRLPGGIFSRAFVRAYAQEVGLDPEAMVREFAERFPDAVQPLRDVAVLAPPIEPSSSGRSWGGVVAALVLLLAAGAGVVMMGWAELPLRMFGGDEATPTPVAAAPLQMTAPAVPLSDTIEPVAGFADSAPDAVPAAGTASGAAPGGTAVDALARLVALGADEPMRLGVHPVARCWVRVVADGRVVLARELSAGERAEYDATAEIVVTVGDAGAFAYSINDVPGRSLGASGKVVTIRIQRSNLTDFVAS